MKKLKLDLGDLHVQSFDTTPDAAASRGTVHGQDTDASWCGQDSCDGTCNTVCWGFPCGQGTTLDQTTGNGGGGSGTCAQTCPATCPNTCAATCANTCPDTCVNSCYGTCDVQCSGYGTCAGFGDTCDCSCIATAVGCG